MPKGASETAMVGSDEATHQEPPELADQKSSVTLTGVGQMRICHDIVRNLG